MWLECALAGRGACRALNVRGGAVSTQTPGSPAKLFIIFRLKNIVSAPSCLFPLLYPNGLFRVFHPSSRATFLPFLVVPIVSYPLLCVVHPDRLIVSPTQPTMIMLPMPRIRR